MEEKTMKTLALSLALFYLLFFDFPKVALIFFRFITIIFVIVLFISPFFDRDHGHRHGHGHGARTS